MRTVAVKYGQTIFDIALQYLGDETRAFEIALLNDLSLTDYLTPGDLISVPEADQSKRPILQVFALPGNAPASSDVVVNADGEMVINEGIEFWTLETDFEIQ